MAETLVLDPVEWNPDRVELPLNELGLEVLAEGLDYGESSAALEKVRKAIGEGATDRKWPNVDCAIPLLVKAESDVPLAEVAQKLEQKAGLIQREGGSIRRDFDLGGGFAGSVMCPITTIGLPPLQGWMMVHRQAAPGVILKINRHPIWYATVEVEGEEVSAEKAHYLTFEIAEALGSAPGLIRLRIKNENEEGDWGGLIGSIESRDYSEGETAELAYAAEDLTLHGPSELAEKAGSDSTKVVKAAELPEGAISLLSSKIGEEVGHMTHKGARRLLARVYDPSEKTDTKRLEEWRTEGEVGARPSPQQPRLQLESRLLGSSLWTTNPAVVSPVVGRWQVIDLGEARPQVAALGDQRWEWRVTGEAKGEGDEIYIDEVYPLSTEQFFALSSPEAGESVDQFDSVFAGEVTESELEDRTDWTKLENLEGEPDAAPASVIFGEESGRSQEAELRKFGLEVPAGATVSKVAVRLSGLSADLGTPSIFFECEVVVGETVLKQGQFIDVAKGGTFIFPTSGLTAAPVNEEGFGVNLATRTFVGGEATFSIDAVKVTIFYTEVATENKVCFAGRSMEARTDGVFRQHPEDDVWGLLVPEGFLPYAPPSGLESRPARGIVIPTKGNFDKEADAGASSFSVTPIYRPGYLFAREAAS